MSDPLIGKVIADKYRIDSCLGDSRSGRLYLAKHLLIGSMVTVKVLERGEGFEESFAAKFSAEARAVSKIAHPNILNITDFGQDIDGTIFSVMEDASGETLRSRIEREGQMMLLTAVRITRQIASALSAAHAKGMAHGSLTPSKVVLASIGGGSEIVKVFDVGAVRLATVPEEGRPLDELAYAAPELFEPGSKANERSDVYSLGVLFYELLAGEPPFTGASEFEFAEKHIQVPPPPFVAFRGDLPEGIEPVVLTALAKDPEKRFGSVSEFIAALNEAIDDEGAEDAIVIPVQGGNASNNVWKTAFIVLAGISVMAFGLIYWTGSRQIDPASALRTDSNSQPVQPLNPATGIGERNSLATAPATLAADPDDIPADIGGDGYDPWANPGSPPPGRPPQVGPGGDYVTIPGEGSVFMPSEGGVILVPKVVPRNSPEGTASPSPSPPKTDAGGNSNTQTRPKPTPTPSAPKNTNTAPPKSSSEPKPSGAEKRDASKGVKRDA